MTKKASKELGRDDVLVLDQWQTTDNVNDKGQTTPPPMNASTQQYAIDKSSGEALKWSGNTLDGKPTNYEGQTIKFPFQVDKNKTYRYWDSTLGKAVPMKYAGSEDIKGLKTYKFTQTIPKTKFTTMDVPGEVFGLPKGSKLADRYYTNDRTVWVEPETGVMMKLQEKQHQTLEVPNAKPVDAMLTTSTMTDETIKKNVDDYKTKSSQLKILRLWAPLLLGLLGLFALLLGLFVSLRVGRRRRAGRHERRDEPVQDSTLVFGDRVGTHDAHGAHVIDEYAPVEQQAPYGEQARHDERGRF